MLKPKVGDRVKVRVGTYVGGGKKEPDFITGDVIGTTKIAGDVLYVVVDDKSKIEWEVMPNEIVEIL